MKMPETPAYRIGCEYICAHVCSVHGLFPRCGERRALKDFAAADGGGTETQIRRFPNEPLVQVLVESYGADASCLMRQMLDKTALYNFYGGTALDIRETYARMTALKFLSTGAAV